MEENIFHNTHLPEKMPILPIFGYFGGKKAKNNKKSNVFHLILYDSTVLCLSLKTLSYKLNKKI